MGRHQMVDLLGRHQMVEVERMELLQEVFDNQEFDESKDIKSEPPNESEPEATEKVDKNEGVTTEVVDPEKESVTTTQKQSEEHKKTDLDEEEQEKQSWTYAAVKDERRKRQELEKKIAELEAKQSNKKDEVLPDILDDQEGFVQGIRSEYQREFAKAKLEIAREMMLENHSDYEEMEKLFLEKVVKENPILAEQAKKASNPAKFVYQQSKNYLQYEQMQNVDSFKEKIRAEVKAEIETEMAKSAKEKESLKSSITPSLATARASTKDDAAENVTLESLIP